MARRSITRMRKSKHRFKITVNKAEESIAVIKNIHQGDKTAAQAWSNRRKNLPSDSLEVGYQESQGTSTPTKIQWEYEAPCTRGVKSLMLLMV